MDLFRGRYLLPSIQLLAALCVDESNYQVGPAVIAASFNTLSCSTGGIAKQFDMNETVELHNSSVV